MAYLPQLRSIRQKIGARHTGTQYRANCREGSLRNNPDRIVCANIAPKRKEVDMVFSSNIGHTDL